MNQLPHIFQDQRLCQMLGRIGHGVCLFFVDCTTQTNQKKLYYGQHGVLANSFREEGGGFQPLILHSNALLCLLSS